MYKLMFDDKIICTFETYEKALDEYHQYDGRFEQGAMYIA